MTQETYAQYAARRRREREGGNPGGAVLTLDSLRNINPDLAATVQRGRGNGPAVYDRAAQAEAEATESLTRWRSRLELSPQTSAFLNDPANAAVAHDQVDSLSWIEQVFTAPRDGQQARDGSGYGAMDQLRWTGDVGRRALGGVLTGFGTAFRGAARYGEDARSVPQYGIGGIASTLDHWGVFREARRMGEAFDLAAADVGGTRREGDFGYFAPAQGTGFVGDVTEGVGQLGGQAIVHAATGGTGTLPFLFAQGVGQADQRQEAEGTRDHENANMAAIGEGVVIAGLERLGFWAIFERLPQAARNRVVQRVMDVVVGAGVEGSQEATEEVLVNAIYHVMVDPEAPILTGDVVHQGAVGSGVGAVARSIVGMAIPGRRLADTERQVEAAQGAAETLDRQVEAVAQSGLAGRSPEHMQAFIAPMAGEEEVFVPAEVVGAYLQGRPDGADLARAWGVADQLAEAQGTGADIVFDPAAYRLVGTEAHSAFREDLRLGQGAMSLREAGSFNREAEAEATVTRAVEDAEARQPQVEARQQVYDDIYAQAVAAGQEPTAAREYAALWAQTYATFADRSPEVYADAWAAYRSIPTTIRGSDQTVAPRPPRRRTEATPPSEAPATIRPIITGAASEFGVSEAYLTNLARRESSFDPRARAGTSSAAGLYQFTRDTWLRTLRAHGARLGVQVEGQSEADLLELRFNGTLNARAAALLTLDNAAYLRRTIGREPTDAELYTAHFLGPAGASRLAVMDGGAIAASAFPRAAAANRTIFYEGRGDSRRARTVDEVRAVLGRGFDGSTAIGPPSTTTAAAEVEADPIFGSTTEAQVAARPERDRATAEVQDLPEIPAAPEVEAEDFGAEFDRLFAQSRGSGPIDPIVDEIARYRADEGRVGAQPVLAFLRQAGGLQASGDLTDLGLSRRRVGGGREAILSDSGLSVEEATRLAVEAGVIEAPNVTDQDAESYQPEPALLMEAIEREVRSGAVQREETTALESAAARLGLDLMQGEPDQIARALREDQESRDREYEAGGWVEGEVLVEPDDDPFGVTLYQDDARGQVEFKNGEALVTLFRSRDLSTLLHEGAHIFLINLAFTANQEQAGESVKRDYQALLDWFGVSDWSEVTTDHHEAFAEAFEAYLQEGRTPSQTLRGAFRAFARWLTSIYRTARSMRVPINDEIRGVFDRLIASDEEIVEARRVSGADAMFDTAAAAGMTEAEFRSYSKLAETARETSEDRMLRRLMRDLRRERTAYWREEAEAIRDDVAAEIDATPEMTAFEMVMRGGRRINRTYAEAILGVEGVKALPRGRHLIVSDKGSHPDALAEEAGFGSGRAMLNALVDLEADRRAMKDRNDRRSIRTRRIDDRIAEVLHERHGDLWSDEAIADAAQEALHSGAQGALLDAEARSLSRRAKRNVIPAEILKTWAEDQIRLRPYRALREWRYLQTERRYAREAIKLAEKGDLAGAAEAKDRQRVNFHMWREAKRVQAMIEQAERRFARVLKHVDGRGRDSNMVEAAKAILAAYGYVSGKSDPRAYLALVEAYDPAAFEVLRPVMDRVLADIKPESERTVAEFEALNDAVSQLWAMSRYAKTIEIDGEQMSLEAAGEALIRQLRETHGDATDARGARQAVTDRDNFMLDIASLGTSLKKVEEWAIRQGPQWTRIVWRPISKSADAFRADQGIYLPKLEAALRTLEQDWRTPFRIPAPEIGYEFGARGGNGIAEIIGAMRHLGNASNRRKLLLGRGWATLEESGFLDDSRFEAFMRRMHDEGVIQQRHWDYVQAEWDLNEEIKPIAQAAHQKVFGRYFEEVSAEAVRTPFGEYRGGYVAALVDPEIDQDAALRQAEGLVRGEVAGSFTFPSPARGFTKARTEYNRPLNLDLRQAIGSLNTVLTFSHMAAPVRQVLRTIRQPSVASALSAYDPVAMENLLLPWLGRAASQRTTRPSETRAGRVMDRVIGSISRSAVAQIMFGNVVNAAEQFTSLIPATLRTGKRNLGSALAEYMLNPGKVTRAVREMSPMMAARASEDLQDLVDVANEFVLNPSPLQTAQAWSRRRAFFLQRMVMTITDPIVWTAAYNRGVERGEEFPQDYADSVVRTTMESRNPEDLSAFSVGPRWASALKTFTGFFIGQANVLATEIQQGSKLPTRAGRVARYGEVYVFGFAAIAIASRLIVMALRGQLEDDEDDGWWDELGAIFLLSQIQYALAMIPVGGAAVSAGINSLDDKPYNDRMSLSPAVTAVETAVKVPRDLMNTGMFGESAAEWAPGRADASQTVSDLLTAIGLTLGVPTLPRQAGYIADVAEGDVEPTGPADAARGVATGSASVDSRN